MGKHRIDMTEAEREDAIAVARALAADFDRVGPGCDERNEFCFELVEPFRESGLVEIAVPKQYGGGGADIWTVAQISRELAKGDPACALAFNMHQTMVGVFRGLLSDEAKERWFTRIAAERLIVCGPFSEERAGFMGLSDTTAARATDGTWMIDGSKTWATLSQAADLIAFNATVATEPHVLPRGHDARREAESVFIVDMRTPGISIKETWDTLGMRATGTQTVVFDGVRAPGDAEVGDFRGGLMDEFEWAALSFTGCYVGLQEKAYAHARDTLRRKSLGAVMESPDQALRDLGHVQWGLGEMRHKCHVSALVLDATAQLLFDGRDEGLSTLERVALVDAAKVQATEHAIEVCDRGMRLIGGSTFRRGSTLERLYRDARSGPFHPLTTDQEFNLLGQLDLGLVDGPDAPGQPDRSELVA